MPNMESGYIHCLILIILQLGQDVQTYFPPQQNTIEKMDHKIVSDKGAHLARRRFPIIWDDLTAKCLFLYNIEIDLRSLSIIENEYNGWVGNQITIMGGKLGLYPQFGKNGTIINGGVPQAVNLQDHLNKVASDIEVIIPNAQFRGLGIFDWEAWLPIFKNNRDSRLKYRDLSIRIVKQQHPSWDIKHVEAEAERQFNTAARAMMEGTLNLAKQLRPYGKWGYYSYPKCSWIHTITNCSKSSIKNNNKLSWLWKASTALYPRIYIRYSVNHTMHYLANRNLVSEAVRVKNYIGQPNMPVYPYSLNMYNKADRFFDEQALKDTLLVSSQYGATGVVVWGGADRISSAQKCLMFKDYVTNVFGPFLLKYL